MSLNCMDVIERFGLTCGCCDSCHDDHDDGGYDLCWKKVGDEEANVCCRVLQHLPNDIAPSQEGNAALDSEGGKK